MAFHDVRLDTTIATGAVGGPSYTTIVQTTASGHEYRLTRQSAARRRYEFSKLLLSADEWSGLLDFAAQRRGHLHSFRWKDWSHFTTSPVDGRATPSNLDQVIGTGDGVETQFQLFLTRGVGGVNPEDRAITLPVAGTVVVSLDGSGTAAWTLTNPGGVLTFSSAPGVGVVVRAGCEFDVPVRFDMPQEWVAIELGRGILGGWDRIGLIEVLDEVQTPELWYPGGSSGTIVTATDYTVTFAVELWTLQVSAAINVFLPPPDRVPGGHRILTIHNLAASSNTIQIRDDAGNAVGSTFAAGATKRLLLSRSGSSATWIAA